MKKKFIVLFLLSALLLQSCGGVSQKEYDDLVSENKELSNELTELKTDNKTSVHDNNISAAISWAKSSFGDDCIILSENNDYLQCICQDKYEITQDDLQKMNSRFIDSISLLVPNFNDITYKKISVKFIQPNGNEIIDITIVRTETSYSLDSILYDGVNYDKIIQYLTPASSTPAPTSSDEFMAEIEKNAQKSAANSTEITSGELYEACVSVYPDIELSDIDHCLSIGFSLSEVNHKTLSKIMNSSITLLDVCSKYGYSDFTVSIMSNDGIVGMVTINDYKSSDDFSCSSFCLNDEYEELFASEYNNVYSYYDISSQFDRSLDDIKDKYGLND